ncbi:MAG: PAS domain S-box protein, partial [Desulfuromonadales bacterium]|nr:PAS domain S-box protein [Desulfuromonadales bacterium]
FGFREAANFNLVPTTIEFEPFSVFFATKKDTNSHILKHIDQHLTNWKRNSDSIYYERVAYWMGGSELERKVIPQWIYLVILSIVIGAIILVLINASLKHQVKLRTQELSLREARFRTLSETTKAVPWELDIASGNFTYIGPRIVDVYGYPIEEWRNLQDLADKIHPEDRQEAMDFCHAETKQGRDHDFVYRGIHKDGREIWIHDIVTVSMGAKGPEKLYGYFVDITEIREHAQRFQKMFREHTAVMLLIDPESGSVVDANSAACRFYGYTREELISLPITRLNTLSAEEIREATRQALQAERNYFEFTHRLANGELRNIEAYSSPIVINKKPLLFAIVHDTTERKKLLEEHGRAAQLVALGTVAAGVAHEINNPINGIINYAQLLSSKPDESKRVSALSERISIEAERIAKITSDLLHYSKDNREEMKACDTRELIEGALSLIVPKIRPSGIKVKNTLADDAPGLMANPQGLQQIVINLVDNAYDALREKAATTEDKTIQVRSYLINVNGQPMFCLEVKDNGTGMDEKVKTKAKDAFFSTKPSTEGTGLGLSIVNDIVNRHNGSFEIDSKQGEYTRIQILLPMTKG